LARSPSSDSAFMAGSNDPACSTIGAIRLITRSLLVPKILVKVLAINE